MKKLLLVILMIFSITSFSQKTKKDYESVISTFKMYYNEENYEAIFKMLDKNMKKLAPQEKFKSLLTRIKDQAGKIESMTYTKDIGNGKLFKTDHEKLPLDYVISLNNNNEINGFHIQNHKPENAKKLERNTTKLILPFKGEWLVFWGGTTKAQNYHVAYENQQGAFDFVVVGKNGKSYKTNGKTNEDYYAFGKEIIAPANGKIVKVIKGVKDNVWPGMNAKEVVGNCVVLETPAGEYVLFAHLQAGGVAVKEGQEVKQGDVLGLCGNSGNSSEPHLHFSIQNVPEVYVGTGARAFFDKIWVDGELKEDYSPVKNEKIQNIKL